MRPINLIHHDFDVLANKHWTESKEAFLIGERIVVRFDVTELLIYKFPQSLAEKSEVDYWPSNGNVNRFTLYFEGFQSFEPFDITKPLAEIITKLTEVNK